MLTDDLRVQLNIRRQSKPGSAVKHSHVLVVSGKKCGICSASSVCHDCVITSIPLQSKGQYHRGVSNITWLSYGRRLLHLAEKRHITNLLRIVPDTLPYLAGVIIVACTYTAYRRLCCSWCSWGGFIPYRCYGMSHKPPVRFLLGLKSSWSRSRGSGSSQVRALHLSS